MDRTAIQHTVTTVQEPHRASVNSKFQAAIQPEQYFANLPHPMYKRAQWSAARESMTLDSRS